MWVWKVWRIKEQFMIFATCIDLVAFALHYASSGNAQEYSQLKHAQTRSNNVNQTAQIGLREAWGWSGSCFLLLCLRSCPVSRDTWYCLARFELFLARASLLRNLAFEGVKWMIWGFRKRILQRDSTLKDAWRALKTGSLARTVAFLNNFWTPHGPKFIS
jgi:hypothetical protein